MINISFGDNNQRQYNFSECYHYLTEYIFVFTGKHIKPFPIQTQKQLDLFLKMMQNVLYWVENEREEYIRNRRK
jgi:hypothetical protein